MHKVLLLKPQDNVATCLADFGQGEVVTVERDGERITIALREDIGFGHKVAAHAIAPGEPVTKYGETIGVASCAITAGDWVHVHNIESVRARGDKAVEDPS